MKTKKRNQILTIMAAVAGALIFTWYFCGIRSIFFPEAHLMVVNALSRSKTVVCYITVSSLDGEQAGEPTYLDLESPIFPDEPAANVGDFNLGTYTLTAMDCDRNVITESTITFEEDGQVFVWEISEWDLFPLIP